MDNWDKFGGLVVGGFFVGTFLLIILLGLSDLVFHFDIAPASGTANGYIYYQEKSGLYQLEWVCWKDTPYADCETFDPAGKHYEPGKYTIQYQCTQFVWSWEHPSECRIVNATRTGDVS